MDEVRVSEHEVVTHSDAAPALSATLARFALAAPLIQHIRHGAAHGMPFRQYLPELKRWTEAHAAPEDARRAALHVLFACSEGSARGGPRLETWLPHIEERARTSVRRVHDFFADESAICAVLVRVWAEVARAPDRSKRETLLAAFFAEADYDAKRDPPLDVSEPVTENCDRGPNPHVIQMLLAKRALGPGASLCESILSREPRVFKAIFASSARNFTNPSVVSAALELMLGTAFYERRYMARVDVRIYRLAQAANLPAEQTRDVIAQLMALKQQCPVRGFEINFWPRARALVSAARR